MSARLSRNGRKFVALTSGSQHVLTKSQDFPGIYTCHIDDRLDTIFDTIRKSRVHRLIVVDDDNRLTGLLTLSDILEYILLEGEGDDGDQEQRERP